MENAQNRLNNTTPTLRTYTIKRRDTNSHSNDQDSFIGKTTHPNNHCRHNILPITPTVSNDYLSTLRGFLRSRYWCKYTHQGRTLIYMSHNLSNNTRRHTSLTVKTTATQQSRKLNHKEPNRTNHYRNNNLQQDVPIRIPNIREHLRH